ncbi:MAG: hypothetical protein A2W19_17150 [Spirochaetes bacterium RBG_16_49_21]|nr:MAG: hypothetical protein A2W19_17150 [Spirochaetes bacterium RBG_16_49_21]
MPKTAVKTPSFDEYKSIKDEIIEISELRFENLLTKKLDQFRRDFKKELMDEINARFDGNNAKFDAINSRFGSIDSKIETLKWSVWSLPLVMTVLMALFTILLKYVIKI